MKKLKIVAAVLMIGALVLLSMSCSNSSATATAVTKTATVQRSNLSVSITGTGNLAYSKTENLAFEMAGYVEDVLVSEGDTVSKGDEIARLNTSDWEDDIKTLTKTLTKSQRSFTTAQEAVTKAQRNLVSAQAAVTTAQRNVTDKGMNIQSAELDLKSLEYALSDLNDVKVAQDRVDNSKTALDIAKVMLSNGATTAEHVTNLESTYESALETLNKVKSGSSTSVSSNVNLQISQYQFKIKQAQLSIDDAKIAVEDAQTAVTNAQLDAEDAKTSVSEAQLDLADAQQSVTDAQANLDETQGLSPIIKAPFDGFITSVKVSGGNEVFKGTVAAVISDPEQFEADILVTENDIFTVEVGGAATVSLDALSDVTYPAKVTFISPTASVSSGVVNYSVTVELTSLTPVSTASTAAQFPSGTMPSGTPPSGVPMGTPPAANGSSGGTAATATAAPATTSTATTAVTLKEGLSATVKIISEEAAGVLVVPSRAITTQGQKSTVQVVNGTGTETRDVTVGMTDGTNSEIKSGLSEGEQVTYRAGTSSSSSSSSKSSSSSQSISIGGGGPPPGGF
jgi:HlyD family secretion protein